MKKDQKGFGLAETLLALLVIVVIGVIGFAIYHHSHEHTNHPPLKTAVTSLPYTVAGSGSKTTKLFTTSADWSVNTTYNCQTEGSPRQPIAGTGKLTTTVMNSDGSADSNDSGFNGSDDAGESANQYNDAGKHYINVSVQGQCSWSLQIKG
jgi:Tfp pilus assembly protein PilV